MIQMILAAALTLAVPQQTDTTLSVRPGGRLEVDNYGGSVTVRSWNRNEVRVQAVHSSRTDVDVRRSGSNVSVDASDDNGNPEVRYTINVPRSFRVSIDGIESDALVENIDGDVSVSAVDGNITIRSITGRVTAESVSGFVALEGIRGNVEASNVNQGIRLANITGDVDVEAVNGSIVLRGLQSSHVAAETVNGGIMMESTIRDGGSYALATTNGTITISIPEGTNAQVEAETFSGRVDTSLPIRLDKRKSGSYSFRIGSGSANVSLESFAGTIRLVRPNELREPALNKGKNKD